MRADRLLSLILLLQKHGQITAESLAQELGVSKRTIYRDVDTLSATGVPIYANGGPGGGYALLDSYRNLFTSFNEAEIQALFMLIIPGSLSDLGVNTQLKTAIFKLTSLLPQRHQAQAEHIRQRLHLDTAGWFQPQDATPHLNIVQTATWQDRQLHLTYRRRQGTVSQRTVSPYGLVAKAGIWYMVAATDNGLHVYRISRIETADLTPTHFTRPPTFDLATFWTKWVADYESNLPQYPVTFSVAPDLLPILPYMLGQSILPQLEQAPPDTHGWRTLHYTFERMEEARMYILGMGASTRVIAPEALRLSVLNFANDILTLNLSDAP